MLRLLYPRQCFLAVIITGKSVGRKSALRKRTKFSACGGLQVKKLSGGENFGGNFKTVKNTDSRRDPGRDPYAIQ